MRKKSLMASLCLTISQNADTKETVGKFLQKARAADRKQLLLSGTEHGIIKNITISAVFSVGDKFPFSVTQRPLV